MPPPGSPPGWPVTRRAFLGCCAAIAHSACASLTSQTRAAHELLTDPGLLDYEPVLDGVIKAVLPFEHPGFPVTLQQVRRQLLHLFELEADPRYQSLQRTLQFFDDIRLFAGPTVLTDPPGPDVAGGEAERRVSATVGHTEDQRLFAAFCAIPGETRFAALPLSRQRGYFDLWRRSHFILKREFYAGARAVVLLTAYSMPPVWSAIGYEGPLAERQDRT
jgi:hypothetical protein